jgi:hypothetical protein
MALQPPAWFQGNVLDWSLQLDAYCLDDTEMRQEGALNMRGQRGCLRCCPIARLLVDCLAGRVMG